MYVRGLPVPTTCANMDDDDDGGSGAGVSFKRLSASLDDTIDGNCAAVFFLSVWASQTLGLEHITSLIVIQVTFPQVISTLKLSRLKIGDCTNEL